MSDSNKKINLNFENQINLQNVGNNKDLLTKDVKLKLQQKTSDLQKTAIQSEDQEISRIVEAKKIQMMSKHISGAKKFSNLQVNLFNSEKLKLAQDKVLNLEKDLLSLKKQNKDLAAASSLIAKKHKITLENFSNLKYDVNSNKDNFQNEKDVLLNTLKDAKTKINKLKSNIKELESQLSNDLDGVRSKEMALEGRIDILKMESSILQKEKDNNILDLKKDNKKIKEDLNILNKKNQELLKTNQEFKKKSHRAVSVLRATICNLEGLDHVEDTENTNY